MRAAQLGSVLVAFFPEHAPGGHEQEGARPSVVVGLPGAVGTPRFPVLLLAPVTTFKGQAWVAAAPALYPVLGAGAGGLVTASVVLTDQTRSLDASRLARSLGTLSTEEYAPIRAALEKMLDTAHTDSD